MILNQFNVLIKSLSLAILIFACIECTIANWDRYEYKEAVDNQQHLGTSKGCSYSDITYGNRVWGDTQVYSYIQKQNASFFSFKTKTYFNYKPTSYGYNNITLIRIKDLNTKCNCSKKSIDLQGGVGKSSVNITITSYSKCPNYHNVTIYAVTKR